jgi:hypothetical protein
MSKRKILLLLMTGLLGLAVVAFVARFTVGFLAFIYPSYRLQCVEHLFGLRPTGFELATTRQMTHFLASFYDWPHNLIPGANGTALEIPDAANFCWHCRQPFILHSLPPSGEQMPLDKWHSAVDYTSSTVPDAAKAGGTRPMFIACCAKPGPDGKRVFFFLPNGWELLSDDEVSWYYQRRRSDLTPQELTKEKEVGSTAHK